MQCCRGCRAHTAASGLGLHLIIGSEFTLQNGDKLILLVMNRQGYRELTRLITAAAGILKRAVTRLMPTIFVQTAAELPCTDCGDPAPAPCRALQGMRHCCSTPAHTETDAWSRLDHAGATWIRC